MRRHAPFVLLLPIPAAISRSPVTVVLSWNAVTETRKWQAEEWDRIIARCAVGEISSVYIVVVSGEDEKPLVSSFVYAPAEHNNIKHVMDFAGQGPLDADEPMVGYYATSCFEVGAAVKQAVAVEVERDRILGEIDAGRI